MTSYIQFNKRSGKKAASNARNCTPGMILSVYSLLSEIPKPTDDEIKHCLASNICRCTGYVSDIAAVKRAVALMRTNETGTLAKYGLRLDGREKVRGEPIYTADLRRPGMLYAKILRSPLPHATIKKIETAATERLPGVLAVLTRDDLQDINPYFGPLIKDQAILAIDKVRYEGDPVAAVAAETVEIAEAAIQLIHVEY